MLIEITGVTSGQSPYDVFLCNPDLTSCFYISGNTIIPPSVIIDTQNYFPNEFLLNLKIIDTNGCTFIKTIDCPDGKAFQDDILFIFMDDIRYYFQ